MLDIYLKKHRFNGVFLDTNLLLLYLIGSYDPKYINQFKRTSMYTNEDFDFLKLYVGYFKKVIITPHVLTELWHFLGKIENTRFDDFIEIAKRELCILAENYIPKNDILLNNSLKYIGVTDLSILLTAALNDCLVITDDFRSYTYYYRQNIDVININHLRSI